jgi:hypothetical protein
MIKSELASSVCVYNSQAKAMEQLIFVLVVVLMSALFVMVYTDLSLKNCSHLVFNFICSVADQKFP